MKGLIWILLFLVLCMNPACENTGIKEIQLIYTFDFEDDAGDEWIGDVQSIFNGNRVMGPFNQNETTLSLVALPRHEQLLLEFDLLIHDSWDGNLEGLGGPDIWEIKVDRLLDVPPSTAVYQTTFSNGSCDSNRCLYQSYPQSYPHKALPRSGRVLTSMTPGRCLNANSPAGSTMYHMQIEFPHESPVAVIRFKDYLKQSNSASPSCDESWSMDNLSIYTLDF